MKIKKLLPLQLKCYFKYLLGNKKSWKDFVENIDINKTKIVVALAADYGNLGDVAITLAQEDFLQKNFPEYQIIDFPIAMTYTHMKSLKAIVNEDDIITLVGGGNMGDLYDDIEACRQFVIHQFPKNKIISFPQTICFESEFKLNRCIRSYSSHLKLTLVARETFSYELMKQYFKKAEILLTPDIVLSMKRSKNLVKREGMYAILRDDKESILIEHKKTQFKEMLVNKYGAKFIDTVIKTDRMPLKTRCDKLESLLSVIERSSIIVTNRLHGMIFCAITSTPCIVLPIKGNKITGVMEWISNLNFIKYCPNYDMEKIEQLIVEVSNCTPGHLELNDEFKPLLRSI